MNSSWTDKVRPKHSQCTAYLNLVRGCLIKWILDLYKWTRFMFRCHVFVRFSLDLLHKQHVDQTLLVVVYTVKLANCSLYSDVTVVIAWARFEYIFLFFLILLKMWWFGVLKSLLYVLFNYLIIKLAPIFTDRFIGKCKKPWNLLSYWILNTIL